MRGERRERKQAKTRENQNPKSQPYGVEYLPVLQRPVETYFSKS